MSAFATVHATTRLAERYGLVASEADWADVVLQITERRALLLDGGIRRPHGTDERWMVRIQGMPVFLIWNPRAALIPTVLAGAQGAASLRPGRRLHYHDGARRADQARRAEMLAEAQDG